VEGADQFIEVADTLLEQIAHAGHALGQQVEGVVLLDVLREDDDPDAADLPQHLPHPFLAARRQGPAASTSPRVCTTSGTPTPPGRRE